MYIEAVYMAMPATVLNMTNTGVAAIPTTMEPNASTTLLFFFCDMRISPVLVYVT